MSFVTGDLVLDKFLGAISKLRRATISFNMAVCPSVCPRGITWLPLTHSWLEFMLHKYVCRWLFVAVYWYSQGV